MTTASPGIPSGAISTRNRVAASLRHRHRTERIFRGFGLMAIILSLAALATLITDVGSKGYTAFRQTHVTLQVFLDPDTIDPDGRRDPAELMRSDTQSPLRASLRARFPDVTARADQRELYGLISPSAPYLLALRIAADPSLLGKSLSLSALASDEVDTFIKGHVSRDVPEDQRRISDRQIAWIESLESTGAITMPFNVGFFTRGDSRDPEFAGILGALVGSVLTLTVALLLSFPLAVAAAVYLEEFAPDNRWTYLIEININNLAAVPSIVFGLLGLAVFLNFFGLPRSAPLVGGMVLALMTLPVIIIASRAAIAAVPPSIREAAMGIGASPIQVVFHHVVPLAMPGILTGTIIGMARALGETAPLLMIGMVAFIVDVPHGVTDPSSVLPVQIFLWADSSERAFVERTAAATLVLLAFLVLMNATAVYLRRRFEVRY
ncbi:MAG: phosphate ABC transporter permease PstA [Alphaproteobacteria bacterium]|nr:phosphate ABC transporter permease PstA [Alphaproteobacteria bacterium]